MRFRDHLAGKYEFTNLPIPPNFWQYSFNAAYTREKMVWVSDGQGLDIDRLHSAGDGYKVIKIHKHQAASREY